MSELNARLLPSQSQSQSQSGKSAAPKPLLGLDVKKRGQSARSWMRIDTSGNAQVLEMDKLSIMRRCDLPARDLRLLDPLFVYLSTLLGREKAIVVNLEQIRCIITADEVLLLNSLDRFVVQYVSELQRRLLSSSSSPSGSSSRRRPSGYSRDDSRKALINEADMFSGSSADDLPFEFRALEVALEAACTYLDAQATELENEAYPVLDDLTSKISTLNLERVRRLKSRLVALTRRVQKVRDEIEHLMDDDGDMAEMYLSEKKERGSPVGNASTNNANSSYFGSASAPVSPLSHQDVGYKMLEKTLSFSVRTRHELANSEADTERVEELEMLLEAYFVVIDGTLNKLTAVSRFFRVPALKALNLRRELRLVFQLKEYIDDTEDFINIQLDNVRNQLIQFELLLTTATFVMAIFGVVAGVFGMNIQIDLFDEPAAFKWVLILTGVGGSTIFCAFLLFFKQRRLLFL